MSLAPKPGHVVVRMYNVGFGDCFLLVFPDPELRILIDCGTHPSGPGPRPIEDVVESVLDDVTDDDGARIDVVVCTHRHRDHVAGFGDPRWKDVEVGEVWMPWTEDPRDPEAKRIRERQGGLATALMAALEGAAKNNPAAVLAANSLPNAKEMRTLHEGFAGNPRRRFLPRDEAVIGEIDADLLRAGGVRARVLGPPRDEKTIRDMDPPKGAAYLRAAAAAAEGKGGAMEPFASERQLTSKDLATDDGLKHLVLSSAARSAVRGAAKGDTFGAAVALERAINGTSLVLCFDKGDARLLFPADAQWGTWDRILRDKEATELVERLTLLKVGHHGSHNATPRALVALLEQRASELGKPWAMVPTRPMRMWPLIPKTELIDALGKLTPRLARSDGASSSSSRGFVNRSENSIDAHIPL